MKFSHEEIGHLQSVLRDWPNDPEPFDESPRDIIEALVERNLEGETLIRELLDYILEVERMYAPHKLVRPYLPDFPVQGTNLGIRARAFCSIPERQSVSVKRGRG